MIKRFRSLRGRLIGTYLILILVSMTLIVTRVGFVMQDNRMTGAVRRLDGQGMVIATAVEDSLEEIEDTGAPLSSTSLATVIQQTSQQTRDRILVFDNEGTLLVSSETGNREQFDYGSLVKAALAGQSTHVTLTAADTGARLLVAASPIRQLQLVRGAVILAAPIATVEAQIQRDWILLIGTTLILALATSLAGLWISTTILRPIKDLNAAASQIAAGQFNRRIETRSDDELGELSRNFNRMAANVGEMVNNQKAFVANASHELRTPLTAIRHRAELLIDGAKDDPEVSDRFLQEIVDESDHLARLVQSLLDLSRADAGLSPRRVRSVPLAPLVDKVTAQLAPRAEQARVKIRTDVPANLAPARGDPDEIERVFANLLTNAIKFTRANGAVTISARRETASATGDYLFCCVEDTGIGIPSEDLPHVFERFYRVDKAHSSDREGAGLGLPIVKSIVEAHQGQVGVESVVGRGSQVWFTLPIAETAPTA